jgi:hypothetical protein
MPRDIDRINEVIRELKLWRPGVPSHKMRDYLLEMAGILANQVSEMEELTNEERACQPVSKSRLQDGQDVIRQMLKKSTEIRAANRELLNRRGPNNANSFTLSGYQQGFDRAIGELANLYHIDHDTVDDMEEELGDYCGPRTKKACPGT